MDEILLRDSLPPQRTYHSDETDVSIYYSSSSVFHHLIALGLYCDIEYYGLQLYYYVKTEGCFENYDFIDDLAISITENEGRADRDAAFLFCQSRLCEWENCLEMLYDYVERGDVSHIFNELLVNFERRALPNIDQNSANADAKKIFDARKGLEDHRKVMDGIFFSNPFPYVAEVIAQYEKVDHGKPITQMLEEKIKFKAVNVYNPMLSRMQDHFYFHANQIDYYIENEPYKGHLIGSIIMQYYRNVTELKEFIAYYNKEFPKEGGLKKYLLDKNGGTIDFLFMTELFPEEEEQ